MRAALLACALLGACVMPDLPEGVQAECNSFGDNSDDQECPKQTHCENNCCVGEGDEPVCRQRSANVTGDPCDASCDPTKGNCPGFCNGPDCQNICFNGLKCLTEAATGGAGNFCSRACASDRDCAPTAACREITGVEGGKACVARCDPRSCRRGWRCDCPEAGSCACIPDCRESGGCGRAMKCDPSSGLCKSCKTLSTACGGDAECCSGFCCSGTCAEAACS